MNPNNSLKYFDEEKHLVQSTQIWLHKTSLTLPLFIEVSVPSQESEWSCICVLGVSIWPLSMILSIECWNCSDSVVVLELFRQCGSFKTVPTVWQFQNCSDSVVVLELFRQCGILELFRQCGSFRTVPTVWYFRTVPTVWQFQNCSDSVVVFVFHFIRYICNG